MRPREFSPRATITSVLVISALIAWSYIKQPVRQHVLFAGTTMGTFYEVKIPGAHLTARKTRRLQNDFEDQLKAINQQMSTYLPDSEISRFNASTSTAPFTASLPFAEVVREALSLAEATDGAFDPTVLPLVHAWGFNNSSNSPAQPTAEQLSALRERIGFQKLRAPGPTQIQKTVPPLQLDLGAIAKGYAVDQLCDLLEQSAYANYYVNIGGEIRTRGHSTNDTPWAIAIEVPLTSEAQNLYEIVELSNLAMATSGDYRNYYTGDDGQQYAHIIDPATARPATNRLASVTVTAPTCMQADALATALFVMGAKRGLQWIEAREGLEAYVIVRDENNAFKHASTSGFKALIKSR